MNVSIANNLAQISELQKQVKLLVIEQGWSLQDYSDLLVRNLQGNLNSCGVDSELFLIPRGQLIDSITIEGSSTTTQPAMSPPPTDNADLSSLAGGAKATILSNVVAPGGIFDHVVNQLKSTGKPGPEEDSDGEETDEEERRLYVEARLDMIMGGTLCKPRAITPQPLSMISADQPQDDDDRSQDGEED